MATDNGQLNAQATAGASFGIKTTGGVTAAVTAKASFSATSKKNGFPTHALIVKVELLLNTSWTDVTKYVLVRDDVNISFGRTDESSGMQSTTLVLTLKNSDGRFTPDNTSGAYYPYVQLNTQVRVSVSDTSVTGVGYTGYRFWGEISEWPPQWDVTGRDVYCKITASGVWRRLSQRTKTIGSPYTRFNNQLNASYNLAGYWPMEDGTGSQYFATTTPSTASNMTTVHPANFQPSLSSVGVFPGSDALPTLSGSELSGNITTSSSPTTVQFRFCMFIPPGGDTGSPGNAPLARLHTNGTVKAVNVNLGPAGGGPLQIIGTNASGGVLFTGSSTLHTWGIPMMILVNLTQQGSNILWTLNTMLPGASTWNTTTQGTLAGTVSDATSVIFSPGADWNNIAVGQAAVFYGNPPFSTTSQALNAFTGENALTRFNRLCTEEGIPHESIGTTTTTMGPQIDDTIISLLQDIEDTDGGIIYESRQQLGLGYRTEASLLNQSAAVTLDYNAQQVGQGLNPVIDDALTRNDVTLTNYDGYSVRAYLANGARSLQSPPNGVGTGYEYALSVNSTDHTQVNNRAIQILNCGTVAVSRYPVITANLARTTTAPLFNSIPSMKPGDYLQVVNMPAFGGSSTKKQLVWGWAETINNFTWTLAFNTIPEDPWESSFNPGTSVTGTVPASPTTQTTGAGGTGTVTSAQIVEGAIIGQNLAAGAVQGGNIAASTITATNIASATITGTLIANGSITGAQIASATIEGSNIDTGTITGGNIASGTISGSNIGTGTITGSNIGSATITAGNITNGTITTTQISGTAGITGSQLANNTITASQIANATITTSQISSSANITGTQLANNTITATQIANATITGSQVAGNTITGSNIASGTITASNITNATITNTQIASGTITGSNIAGGTITNSNIQNATITNISIANNTITTSQISNSAGITGTQIANNTITATNIAALTIAAGQLAAGAITAGKIAAGAIDGMTITGANIVADGATGQFLIYSGTPESGNLIGSWSGGGGTDGFGNTYPAGLSVNQGVITGTDVDHVTITNSTFQGDLANGTALIDPSISGGTISETNIEFDSNGGNLLVYTSSTTTVTESSPGDFTWTVPANVTQAQVLVWGAGGGGNGGTTGTGGYGGSGGNCSGNYNYPVTPAAVIDGHVGAGGAASTTGQGDGGDGEDSFFDGFNGVYATGGLGDGSQNTNQQGAGSFFHTGGAGGTGSTSGGGGSGGNSANDSPTNGTGNSGNNASSSTGAASPSSQTDSGTGGAGGNNGANASNGGSPGAGGGGAGKGSSGTGSKSVTYSPTWMGSYYGPDASTYGGSNNALRTHTTLYHGGEFDSGGGVNGTQRSLCNFNGSLSQMASDFSGYTMDYMEIQLKNEHCYFSSMNVELAYLNSLQGGSRLSTYPTGSGIGNDETGSTGEGESHLFSMNATGAAGFVAGSIDTIALAPSLYTSHPFDGHWYGYFDPSQVRLVLHGHQTVAGSETSGTGGNGKVTITYNSGTTLVAAISPISGTDVFGNSFVAGGSFQTLELFGSPSAPSTPPSGSSYLYTNANGSITQLKGSGFTQQLSSGQGNIQIGNWSATTSAGSQISPSYSIPANDANVGTCYRLKAFGYGTFTSGVVYNWGITAFGGTNATASIGAGGTGSYTAYWTCEANIYIVTTGSSGTAVMSCTVNLQGTGRGYQQTAVGTTGAGTVSANTSSSTTMSILGQVGSGSGPITYGSSTFERIGA